MVTAFGLGGNSGAANNPAAEIVPVAAFPPATPFTDHVSDGLEPSLAFAENCCVASPGIEIDAGVTVRANGEGPPVLSVTTEAQPASASPVHDKRRSLNRLTAVSPLQRDSDKSRRIARLRWTSLTCCRRRDRLEKSKRVRKITLLPGGPDCGQLYSFYA